MAVTDEHADYQTSAYTWRMLRDFISGEKAVKDRDGVQLREYLMNRNRATSTHVTVNDLLVAQAYLPPLGGQDVDAYVRYQSRAQLYGASGRTLDALAGAVMRKPPQIETSEGEGEAAPHAIDELLLNIDLAGTPFETFAQCVLREVLAVGRAGVLVDFSGENVPEADRRPYCVVYTAEQIGNWREEIWDGATVLTQVVLRENEEIIPPDGFGSQLEPRYRVLTLDRESGLHVSLWRQTENNDWVEEELPQPTIRGSVLSYIPFVPVGSQQLGIEIQKPPLVELVYVNLHHYQMDADYRHGLHWTALPTAVVTGMDDLGLQQQPLRIGSETAWMLPAGATASMLEFGGAGIGSIKAALNDDENRMALLGARLLENQKREAETAEAMRLRQAGESATLVNVAKTVGYGLQQALRWMAEWLGAPSENIEVELNTDFTESRMPASDTEAYWRIVQGGGMSLDTFLKLLAADDIITDGIEAEKARIQVQGPIGLQQPASEPLPGMNEPGNGAEMAELGGEMMGGNGAGGEA